MKPSRPAAGPAGPPPLASYRLRILFRGVFLLLAVATIALAIVLLQDEKERSYSNHERELRKSHADILAQLRQPAGMLGLLNPGPYRTAPTQPLVLPFAALDFKDINAVFQAADQAGCYVRYAGDSRLCVGVGAAAKSAGYLYVVGSFRESELVTYDPATPDPQAAHRLVVRVETNGQGQAWTVRIDRLSPPDESPVRGRLAAFDTADPAAGARPLRDFVGSLWQAGGCAGPGALPDCERRVFYAMKLPVKAWRERPAKMRAGWPPADLHRAGVDVTVYAPSGEVRFDSRSAAAQAPAALGLAQQTLREGETLTIARQDLPEPAVHISGPQAGGGQGSPLLLRLVSGLPVKSPPRMIELSDTLATPAGSYEVRLVGDTRAIDAGLGAIATRISWYVAAMLGAIALAWVAIEASLIHRIVALSRRAEVVSRDVRKKARGGERIAQLDVSDLRGSDELGILAGGLADLLERVKDDVEREELRARQEREMLEAVGHEILSPLQSLMLMFPEATEPGRYVHRMRQAVAALYGQASPREALQAARLKLAPLDLDKFLFNVASNAAFEKIEGVRYERLGRSVWVQADEYSLEDVVMHILRNADRHRQPGTPITFSLSTSARQARARIHNVGPAVRDNQLDRIFEYGVRDVDLDGGSGDSVGRRGQGLFVARTYMAKMGGTVTAKNEDAGVAFYLELPLQADARG